MLIKYLFKYLTKRLDRIRVVIEDNIYTEKFREINYKEVDEIKTYINCRYITPNEAILRLYEYLIHHRNPTIQRLFLHLQEMENIMFRSNQCLDNILKHPRIHKTTLTEWIEVNKSTIEARELLYTEFLNKWV